MLVQVVGCSHHGTAIGARERLAFSAEQTREALDHWRRVFPGVEAVLLSTCNRVELYAATESQPEPTFEQIATFLARFHGLDPNEVIEHLYGRSDEGAIRHLFAVGEILGMRLASLHSVHYLLSLMREARAAIVKGSFGKWQRNFVARYRSGEAAEPPARRS